MCLGFSCQHLGVGARAIKSTVVCSQPVDFVCDMLGSSNSPCCPLRQSPGPVAHTPCTSSPIAEDIIRLDPQLCVSGSWDGIDPGARKARALRYRVEQMVQALADWKAFGKSLVNQSKVVYLPYAFVAAEILSVGNVVDGASTRYLYRQLEQHR